MAASIFFNAPNVSQFFLQLFSRDS